MNKNLTMASFDELQLIYRKFKFFPEIKPDGDFPSTTELFTKGLMFVKNGEIVREVHPTLVKIAEQEHPDHIELFFDKTLFRSFQQIKEMEAVEYYLHQFLHYYSVSMGAGPYIPAHNVDPFFKKDTKIVPVEILSLADAEARLTQYIENIQKPSMEDTRVIRIILDYMDISLDNITSYEVKTLVCKTLGIVPQKELDFLRYVVYLATSSPLLIKDKKTLNTISANVGYGHLDNQIVAAFKKASLESLAKVFYRFKPIFLAFRSNAKVRPIINKIRRLAKVHHTPLKGFSVQNFYNTPFTDKLGDFVKTISIRDILKLLNAAAQVDIEAEANLFQIRNGKVFIDTEKPQKEKPVPHQKLLVRELIRRGAALKGKIFYFPQHITYGLPLSEKQTIGIFPWGTAFDIPRTKDESTVVGIYWENQGTRVDLDLHLSSPDQDYGWNSYYSDTTGQLLYSGDVTDAENGAAEAFQIGSTDEVYIANVYAYKDALNGETEFQFFASKKLVEGEEKYVYDPTQNLFDPIRLTVLGEGSKSLGLLTKNQFFLYGGVLDTEGRVPSEYTQDYVKALATKVTNQFTFEDFLTLCGAVVLKSERAKQIMEEAGRTVIDLSPDKLTPTTLFDIVDGHFPA